jgi:MFS family permease
MDATRPETSRVADHEKQVLRLTGSAHFMTHLYELAFPALALTVRDDLGWSLAEVLRLSFLMYLLFGIGSLPMGFLSDHWSPRRVLNLAMLGAGLSAVAVSLSQTPWQFTLGLACVGLCISAYHPAGMSLLSRSMRARGRALGINGVYGNLGSASAPFLAGLLAWAFGWRVAYAALGIGGILVGLYGWRVSVDPEHRARVESVVSHGQRRDLWGYFVILCAAVLFGGIAYRGVSLVMPATFLERATFLSHALGSRTAESLQGIGNLSAALLASLAYAMGMLGQVFGGHLADRYDLRKLYLMFHAASLPFLLLMTTASEGVLLIAAGAYVFFSLGMQPIENSLVAHLTPDRWRSTSYGIKFIVSFGGGSLAVYGVSALQARGGLQPVYEVMSLAVGLICVCVLILLWRSRAVRVVNHAIPPSN